MVLLGSVLNADIPLMQMVDQQVDVSIRRKYVTSADGVLVMDRVNVP